MTHMSIFKPLYGKTFGPNKEDFDTVLKRLWEEAQKNGVLKYKLNIKHWKILSGKYRFLVQENIDRGEKRRKPECIISMNQAFDPTRFNFTQLKQDEILLDLANNGQDIIAVNNSPIEKYHSLLVVERLKCLPQIATEYSVRRVIDLFFMSDSPELRVIYNSLCGHASVNHLHWHLYFLEHKMLLEAIELQPFFGPLFQLKDYPAKGFCLKLSSFKNPEDFALWTYRLINFFQCEHIAHNVYITRATNAGDELERQDIRAYVWPRATAYGVKDSLGFIPAVCELFGHISIHSHEHYANISEEAVAATLKEITEETFFRISAEVFQFAEKLQSTSRCGNPV